jgi:hypothetical protein
MRIKDNIICSDYEIRAEYPNVSFAESTYEELGWLPYTVPPVEDTPEQIKGRLTSAVQLHLDSEARRRYYDDIVSACSYAAAPNIFQAEAIALLTWRSNVWATCYAVMGEVESEQRAIPTIEQLIAELPPAPQ